MAKWLKIAVTSGAVAFSAASMAGAQTMTLADALVQAYTTNPQLSLQQATVRTTDEDVISARAALLPTLGHETKLSISRDLGNTPFRSDGDLELQMTTRLALQLYDGGADRNNVAAARMTVLAARAALKNVEQQVLLNTVSAYMNVRREREFVSLAQNNVRVLREQVRAANDRFAVGEVTRTDVSQAQARLAQALNTLASNRGNLQKSIDGFVAVVGKKPGSLRTPPPAPKIPSKVSKAEAVAISHHPRVVEAQYSVKAAELRKESAGKNRLPNITAALTHNVQRTLNGNGYPNDNSLSAELKGSLTLYAGDQLNSQRRSALAFLEQAQSNLQLQGYITRQSLRNAYTDLLTARAAIVSGREQVRAARVAFEGVREEAKLGARTTLDTLDAEQEVLSAKSNLVAAVRNEYVARYSVLSEMGLLTAEHLKLGVPIYNPDVNYAKAVNSQNNPLGTKRLKLFEKLKKRKGN